MKKSTINVIIAAIAAIVLGCVLVSGFQDRNKAMNSITVTGMSQKDFTSDLIVWQGSYTIRNSTWPKDIKTARRCRNGKKLPALTGPEA